MTSELFVVEAFGRFWVRPLSRLDDRPAIGPFATSEEAWRWIDKHTDEGRADTDRYYRIRDAFNDRFK